MTDFKAVQDALAAGAEPAMMCQTCPWDRHCLTPPTMTRAEIDAKLDVSMPREEPLPGKNPMDGVIGGLLTALMIAGKDTQATICPVFALRLRSANGREVADNIRKLMLQAVDA
jgi:hypothetical protein